MSRPTALSPAEIEKYDRIYREGGLRAMASPHVHYDDPECPHAGCGHRMEWIDFKLELHGDPEGVYIPLVRSWWEGTGFVGRCPNCGGWIRFRTLKMEPLDEPGEGPMLPENWAEVAQIARRPRLRTPSARRPGCRSAWGRPWRRRRPAG